MKKKKKLPKLKYFIFIILSLLAAIFLLIIIKSEKFNSNTIENNAFGRELEFYEDSIKVCNKSSENLVKYFQTGSVQYVELHSEEDPDNPPDYIKDLLDFLFNEDLDEEQKNDKIVSYFNHIAAIFFFYFVALACIPGWIVCIFMCIYKCCCCCCCKKPECRKPFFIVVSIMNLAVTITCIVGLSKTNSIFNGVINTECSLLRFTSEVVDGESKSALPKWGGIDAILDILRRTSQEILEMSMDSTETDTEAKMIAYNNCKNQFEADLKQACNDISGENIYKYDDYILDIAKDFGKYDNDKNIFTNNSYADKWIKEAGITDKVEKTYNALGEVIHGETFIAMLIAQDFIEYVQSNMELIQLLLGEAILSISDVVDDYGRLTFNIIFGVLLGFSCFIEFLLIFLYFFSSRKYHSCIMHFLIKILIHILWNIFALLMIVIFIFGTTLTIIGTFGEDFVEVIAYIFSNKNLLSDSPYLLGEDAYLLQECMNGDGNVWDTLGITPSLSDIDQLRMNAFAIDAIIEMMTVNINNNYDDPVFEEFMEGIDKRENLEINFGLVKENSNDKIMLNDMISKLNNALKDCSIGERWSFSCAENFPDKSEGDCSSNINDNKCINPSVCFAQLHDRYSLPSVSCPIVNDYGNIIYTILNAIDYSSYLEDALKPNSLKQKGNDINQSYQLFLIYASSALNDYTTRFAPLTSLFNNLVGNGSIFGFLNCAFLGKNSRILLYYLDSSIGTSFRSLGITIIVIGFAMALSISFTIVLTIIISATMKIREKERNDANSKSLNNNDIKVDNEAVSSQINNENNVICSDPAIDK